MTAALPSYTILHMQARIEAEEKARQEQEAYEAMKACCS
jgi:hypothetical protein